MMYHFMKQNRKARDGPFYEAKLQSNVCNIIWSNTNGNATDIQFYDAKRKRKGWTIL